MKKFVLFLIVIFMVTSVLLFADLTIQYFTGKSNAEGILIEWKTGDEGGVSSFDLERSAGNANNFIYITKINATGNNSYYSYQDNSLTANPVSSSVYFYRLKCIKPNGSSSYTNNITVVYTVSGIKDTWGSIKAIFR